MRPAKLVSSNLLPGGLGSQGIEILPRSVDDALPPVRFALISVVVPARNEAANLPILVEEITTALGARDHEIIIVDDGSSDDTPAVLVALRASGFAVRHVRHDHACGQSRAIRTGALLARGDVVATIDGDGQNDPRFLPQLINLLEVSGRQTALAAGQRLRRTDTPMKQAASTFANRLRSAMLRDGTRDTGCGLKAIPTQVLKTLPYFEGWHRYLPALVLREGLGVVHLDVVDRNRRFGQSNYGIFDRALVGAVDLWGVWWLLRRGRRRPSVTEL